MLYVVLKHEKKKKLHSVVKGSRKFKSQLFVALEESKSNMTAMKGAKEIKQNAKQPCQEDLLVKKIWIRQERESTERRKLSKDRQLYNLDKATTRQWHSSARMKGETEGFILAAQDQSVLKRVYLPIKNLLNRANPKISFIYKQRGDFRPHNMRMPNNNKHKTLTKRCTSTHNKHIHWIVCKHYEIPNSEKW